MRDLISLMEKMHTVLDFDHVEVNSRVHGTGERYVFTFPTMIGKGRVHVMVDVEEDDDRLNVYDIEAEDVEDHPAAYKTRQQGFEGAYATGVRIGEAEVRQVLRFVIKRLRSDGWTVNSVYGDRVTGARAHNPMYRREGGANLQA